MKRNEIIGKLIKEGLSEKTLVNFSDKQINDLAERIFTEQTTSTGKGSIVMKKTSNPTDIKRVTDAGLNVELREKELKGNQKKIDANKNGKIDADDFKILRKEKEVKESEKWIQKAIHPSKKGSLKKALGVKKDETIPAEKLAAAAKKGGKLGQRARLAQTLKKLKENEEVKEWVSKLAENEYHPFTSKNEIMELINLKLTEQEVGPNVKKGHNGVPEFMSYKNIKKSEMGESSPATKPAVPVTKPGEKPKPKHPLDPGKGPNPKPKAMRESGTKTAPSKPKTKPNEKPKPKHPLDPGKGPNPGTKA